MYEPRRPRYESVIVVIVVILVLVLSMGLYAGRIKIQNGRLLKNELQAMRTAVELHIMRERTLPPDLKTLMKLTYIDGEGQPRPYLDKIFENSTGQLIDPFGNPYRYDPRTGRVYTTTRGYKNW